MRFLIPVFLVSCLISHRLPAQMAVRNPVHNDSILSFQTMHVHFDKDIYLPGETIWFKAYLYKVNEVSLAATNFYAALYDNKGKLLQQKLYPVFGGSCYGDFEIPDTIESSRIQFRAFTKAMIADDTYNVYTKIIPVYNKKNNDAIEAKSKTKTLQFFPEGGDAIAEMQNEIGVKATYNDGSPANISGEIIEVERGMLVDTFSTGKMGMGKFNLTPLPHKTYKAVWTDEKGKEQQAMLPPVKRFGVTFHAAIVDRQLQYTVSKNITNDSLAVLHVLAQMGNYQVYKASLALKNEMELSTVSFSIDSLPAGLMQLTLFDSNWNELQKRMVFINGKENTAPLVVKSDTFSTARKGKNIIEISLTDTLFTDLSVAVADVNFYDQPATHSIKQDLMLGTQAEDVEQNTVPLLNEGNDDMMNLVTLTNQWKKYSCKKLVFNDQTSPEPVDNYLSVSVNYNNKKLVLPKDDALNLIINKGRSNQFYNIKPASAVTFKKEGLIFFDSAKVLYQMDRNKELANYLSVVKDSVLRIPSLVDPLPEKINYTVINNWRSKSSIDSFVYTNSNKFNSVKTIKEVVVKSRYKGNPILDRLDELDKFYTSGMFSGSRGYQLNVIDDSLGVSTTHDIRDYILYRVSGLSLLHGAIGKRKTVAKKDRLGGFFADTIISPILFLDEMEIQNADLQTINLDDVAYIKYIPGIVIGAGFNSVQGVIYIYTKRGIQKTPAVQGLPYVYVRGYNTTREFNSPDYSDTALVHQPDWRTTLYWNPNVVLDKANNTIKIEYYNNDISKRHLLKIEGINADGRLIYLEKVLE